MKSKLDVLKTVERVVIVAGEEVRYTTDVVMDHLGNEFKTINNMCEYWKINPTTFANRLKHGLSIEEALTKPINKRNVSISNVLKQNGYSGGVIDHTGQEFKSLTAMCKHWHLTTGEFIKETLDGKSVQEILENSSRKNIVKDHLGNEFTSEVAMCKHWDIKRKVFRDRLDNQGMSIDKALTLPISKKENHEKTIRRMTNQLNTEKVTDHIGNEFNSVKDMCEFWKVTTKEANDRLINGMSLKYALELKNKPVSDHLGVRYKSVKDMCNAYGISQEAFKYRIKCGWSLSRALSTPIGANRIVVDHMGNKFNTAKDMCDYYNISLTSYKSRIKSGWTLKDALETPVGEKRPKAEYKRIDEDGNRVYFDHLENEYETLSKMCNKYGISTRNFKERVRKGMSLKMALMNSLTAEELERTKNETIKDHRKHEFSNLKAMAEYWEISYSKLMYGLKAGKDLNDILESNNEIEEDY